MNLCAICTNPVQQRHHIARPTEATIGLCADCNRRQEEYERHGGSLHEGATPIGAVAEQLCSLPAEIDHVIAANLVAVRAVLALASGERTGARPIANRSAIRDSAPRRDPELLTRELLGAMAQGLGELGLREGAELAGALSAAAPSEQFGEQGRELLALTPRMAEVLTQAGSDPDLTLVEGFFDEARSLLGKLSSGGRSA